MMGFPDRSVGRESACNAGDPVQFLGREDPLEKGQAYPLQYSWTCLVASPIKNLPAMRETLVQSLGWEDPLKKGQATLSNILVGKIPWRRERYPLQYSGLENSMYSPWGHKESDTTEQL